MVPFEPISLKIHKGVIMSNTVVIETNLGLITIQLAEEKTPITVSNFKRYVQEGFYNGTIFHRVIDGFMVQGGGFDPGMRQKTTHSPIKNEANIGLNNRRGTISMARTNDPHSASCQFFINLKDNAFLDHQSESMQGWGYCAFGQVTKGMEIVDKIAKVKTGSKLGHGDVPLEDIVIEKAELF